MKINTPFVYACYMAILAWMFTSNEIIFKLVIVLFIIAMTFDNLKPDFVKSSINEKGGKN